MLVSMLGCGVVGLGVYNIIKESEDFKIANVLVRPVEKDVVPETVFNIDDIVSDNSEVVLECMGGVDFAYMCAEKCIGAGKSFITSNKALVAAKGLELSRLAEEKGVSFLFSAACGGAIPVLHNISVARETDRILNCGGILNGTTNFILSSLREGKFVSYKEALDEAKKLGYAEADPTADVSGMDTMRKVILLSAVAFGKLPVDGYSVEGIENIDLCPYKYKRDDYTVKLIGRAKHNEDGSVTAYVEPAIFKTNSTFGSVNSNFNMAFYTGENSGRISIFGQGAGRVPTASAMMRDLTEILRTAKGSRSVMISESCEGVSAMNEAEKHNYILAFKGEKPEFTEPVSVSFMHSRVKKERESGRECFFAAFYENAEV